MDRPTAVPGDSNTSDMPDGYTAGNHEAPALGGEGQLVTPEQDSEDSVTCTTASSFAIYRLLDRLPWSRGWSIAIIGGGMLLIPAIVLWEYWQDGILQTAPVEGIILVRPFFPALVVTYVLIVVQLLERTREDVARSLRPLVRLDDEAYAAVIEQACRVRPIGELIGFGIGVALFFSIVGLFNGNPDYYLFSLHYYVASFLMFGAVGWSVAAVIAITRLTNSLLREPIEVDIFDVAPLEPVGLQSLYLSLFFLGLVVFIFPSSPFPMASWQNIAIYSLLAAIVVLVFFVNMYSTHGYLAGTKKQRMKDVEDHFARAYGQLNELAATGQDTHMVATELNAWAVAKHELKVTRTWPYNTEMLRTLVISILAPLLVGLSRIVAALLAGGGQ